MPWRMHRRFSGKPALGCIHKFERNWCGIILNFRTTISEMKIIIFPMKFSRRHREHHYKFPKTKKKKRPENRSNADANLKIVRRRKINEFRFVHVLRPAAAHPAHTNANHGAVFARPNPIRKHISIGASCTHIMDWLRSPTAPTTTPKRNWRRSNNSISELYEKK